MKLLKNDSFLKILSLAIAIGLWFYIVQVYDPDIEKTFRDVPVVFSQISDLERKNLTLINDKEITIDVEIRGNRKNIMNISSADITVLADVSTVQNKGENTVATTVILPYGDLEVSSKRPSTVKVNVDALSTKGIDVKVLPTGDPKQGYVIGNVEMTPEKIWVTGAESVVESINYIGAGLDVTGKSSDIAITTSDLKTYDSNNNEMTSQLIKLDTENINIRCEILKVENVKIKPIIYSELIRDGYSYQLDRASLPSSVNIKGAAELVDDITTVDTMPITIDDIDNSGNAEVKLNLPEGVSLFSGDTFTIKFIKQPLVAETETSQ